MRSRIILLCAMAFFSCRENQVEPAGGVTLDLRVAPSVASRINPVKISANGQNIGATTNYRMEGCGYWAGGMNLEIIGPDGNPVFLSNPLARPMCADMIVGFVPGATINGTAEFNGTVFNVAGRSVEATSGLYTVVIQFPVSDDAHFSDARVIVRRQTFQWRPALAQP